jgi:hypothetical protein
LHGVLEKYFQKNFKNAKFWLFDFHKNNENINLEVVLPTSKYKKWIFWIIFSISYPGNCFHQTFSFFSKMDWKSSKILKIGFFEKICFFWKNAIFQKNYFLYLEVGKTTSRLIFWWKSKNHNFAFLKLFWKCFSRTPVQALEFYFFVSISKVEVVSFYQIWNFGK